MPTPSVTSSAPASAAHHAEFDDTASSLSAPSDISDHRTTARPSEADNPVSPSRRTSSDTSSTHRRRQPPPTSLLGSLFNGLAVGLTRVVVGKRTARELKGFLSGKGTPLQNLLFGAPNTGSASQWSVHTASPSTSEFAGLKKAAVSWITGDHAFALPNLLNCVLDYKVEAQRERREQIVLDRQSRAAQAREAEAARQAEVPPIKLGASSKDEVANWLIKHSDLSHREMHELQDLLQQMLQGTIQPNHTPEQIRLLTKYTENIKKHIDPQSLPESMQANAGAIEAQLIAEALAAAQHQAPIQLQTVTDEDLAWVIVNHSKLTLSEMKELHEAFHNKRNGDAVDLNPDILNKFSANITSRMEMNTEDFFSQLDPAARAQFNQAEYFLDRQLTALGMAINQAEEAATKPQAAPPLKLATATADQLGDWMIQHSNLTAQEMQQLLHVFEAMQAGQMPTAAQLGLLSKYKTNVEDHIEKFNPEDLIPKFIVGERRAAMLANITVNKMMGALEAALLKTTDNVPPGGTRNYSKAMPGENRQAEERAGKLQNFANDLANLIHEIKLSTEEMEALIQAHHDMKEGNKVNLSEKLYLKFKNATSDFINKNKENLSTCFKSSDDKLTQEEFIIECIKNALISEIEKQKNSSI